MSKKPIGNVHKPAQKPVAIAHHTSGAIRESPHRLTDPGSVVRTDSIQTQAAALCSPTLSTIQRQALVAEIGHTQGNRHLMQVLRASRSDSGDRTTLQRNEAPPSRPSRLLDHKYKHYGSNDDIRSTKEYRSYMDPQLVWQWQMKVMDQEALAACSLIIEALRVGEKVAWPARAHEFILKVRQQKPEEAPAPEPVETTPKVHHYRVELKAWIPHERVGDPVPKPGESYYRGDGHAEYEGTYRVLNTVEFDWDGQRITNFKGKDNYGTTHRDYEGWITSGTESKTATGDAAQELKGPNVFEMWIDSTNPIPIGPAPAINSFIKFEFLEYGHIVIHYSTDTFPSHAYRVSIDGQIVDTRMLQDVSGIQATTEAIAVGLTDYSNHGWEIIDPEALPETHPKPPPSAKKKAPKLGYPKDMYPETVPP